MDTYRRSPLPVNESSKERYLQEELKKLERVLQSMQDEINRLKTANNLQ
jgi:hypothetical protein